MTAIVNFSLLFLVVVITCIVFSAVKGNLLKALTGLGGAAVFVLVVLLLPNANEEARQAATPAPSAPSEVAPRELAPTVGVTLRNYKEKGDSMHLECSGPTGNVTCKPKK